jgi:hypothetical protein
LKGEILFRENKKKYRVFLSQPFTGHDIEDIKKLRKNAFKKIKESIELEHPEYDVILIDTMKNLKYDGLIGLGKAISMLHDADVVYFVNECQMFSRGCRIEHEICESFDIPIKYIMIDEGGDFHNVL